MTMYRLCSTYVPSRFPRTITYGYLLSRESQCWKWTVERDNTVRISILLRYLISSGCYDACCWWDVNNLPRPPVHATSLPSSVHEASHYSDVIMSAMSSQITSLTIVYSSVYSGADQRKHYSSASLAFVREIHRWPVNSPSQRASNAENASVWWRHHEARKSGWHPDRWYKNL